MDLEQINKFRAELAQYFLEFGDNVIASNPKGASISAHIAVRVLVSAILLDDEDIAEEIKSGTTPIQAFKEMSTFVMNECVRQTTMHSLNN